MRTVINRTAPAMVPFSEAMFRIGIYEVGGSVHRFPIMQRLLYAWTNCSASTRRINCVTIDMNDEDKLNKDTAQLVKLKTEEFPQNPEIRRVFGLHSSISQVKWK